LEETVKFKYLLVTSIVFVGACAQQPNIIVDKQGVDEKQYQQDLLACEQYASQVDSKAAKGAVGGAVVGGAVGSVLSDRSTGEGAGVGAITGLVRGASKTRQEKNQVVKNCLRNRNYKVLN
jgi:outer membrane lipoprotein SlyB